MSLTLALNSTPGTTFSSGATLTTPLSLTFDGVLGGEKEVQLLLTNGSGGTVTVTKIEADGLTAHPADVDSIEFKLDAEDTYVATSLVQNIVLNTTDSRSFFMKVKIPAGRDVLNISNIGLKVTW